MTGFAYGDVAVSDGFLVRVWRADGTWAGDVNPANVTGFANTHAAAFGRDGALYLGGDFIVEDALGLRVTAVDGDLTPWGEQPFAPRVRSMAADPAGPVMWSAGDVGFEPPATGALHRVALSGEVAASTSPHPDGDALAHVAAGVGVVYFSGTSTDPNVLYTYDPATEAVAVGVTFDADFIRGIAVNPVDGGVWVLTESFSSGPGMAGGGLWHGDSALTEVAACPYVVSEDPWDFGGWDENISFDGERSAVTVAPGGDWLYVAVYAGFYGGHVLYRVDPVDGSGRDVPWVLPPEGEPTTSGVTYAACTRPALAARGGLRQRQRGAGTLRQRQRVTTARQRQAAR